MKTRLTLGLLAVIATTVPAIAGDAQITSTVQEDFKVSYEKQSGEPTDVTLSKGASSVGYTSVNVPDRGSTAITIADGTGEIIAKGKVTDNGVYVVLPTTTGYTLASAGTRAQYGDTFPGVVIVNSLPEKYTVDLFGSSGKVGQKNVKLAKTLDVKQAIKLPAGDDSFKAIIHLPDGTDIQSQASVTLGRYHVIHKGYDGKVTISNLGYLEAPKAAKKK